MSQSKPTITEQKVLVLYLKFYSHAQIGQCLKISERTSRTHLYNLRQKFELFFELECEAGGYDYFLSGKCRLLPVDDEDDPQLKLRFDLWQDN